MRWKNLAVLTAGLGLALSFLAPAAAQADTNHGCDELQNIGTEYYGLDDGGGHFYFLSASGYSNENFCNLGIPINGEFEILSKYTGGCLAIDTTNVLTTVDTASACAQDGGRGYAWDRWTAISIKYHNNQLWMLQSAEYPGYCIHAETPNPNFTATADWVPCNSSDHYQWFNWYDVGL
jgi:hypothetical protein